MPLTFDLQYLLFVLDRDMQQNAVCIFWLIGAVLIDAHGDWNRLLRFLRERKRMDEFKKIVFPISEQEIRSWPINGATKVSQSNDNKWLELREKLQSCSFSA